MKRFAVLFALAVAGIGVALMFVGGREPAETPASVQVAATDETGQSKDGMRGAAGSRQEAEPVSDSAVHADTLTETDRQIRLALGRTVEDGSCTVETVYVRNPETGEMMELRSCEPDDSIAEHAYAGYSDAALESLAYGDAYAAMVLATRDIDRNRARAWNLMIRASALLGGRSEPFSWLANHRYSALTKNGELQVESIRSRFLLEELQRRLGRGKADPDYWRRLLLAAGEDVNEVANLEKGVDTILLEMQQIEQEVSNGNNITTRINSNE